MAGRAGGRRGPTPHGVEKELRQAVGRGKPGEKPTVKPTWKQLYPAFFTNLYSLRENRKSPGISWFDLEWCGLFRLFPGFSCRSSHHCCPRCSSPQRETSLAAPKSRPEFLNSRFWRQSWRNHDNLALRPVSEHQISPHEISIFCILLHFSFCFVYLHPETPHFAFLVSSQVLDPGAHGRCLCHRAGANRRLQRWYMIILQIVSRWYNMLHIIYVA